MGRQGQAGTGREAAGGRSLEHRPVRQGKLRRASRGEGHQRRTGHHDP